MPRCAEEISRDADKGSALPWPHMISEGRTRFALVPGRPAFLDFVSFYMKPADCSPIRTRGDAMVAAVSACQLRMNSLTNSGSVTKGHA
jgi:hypothetical protein